MRRRRPQRASGTASSAGVPTLNGRSGPDQGASCAGNRAARRAARDRRAIAVAGGRRGGRAMRRGIRSGGDRGGGGGGGGSSAGGGGGPGVRRGPFWLPRRQAPARRRLGVWLAGGEHDAPPLLRAVMLGGDVEHEGRRI